MKASSVRWTLILLFSVALIAGRLCAQAAPQGGAPQTVRVGGNVKPPIKIKDVKPEYPQQALRQRIQGVIIIETTIGTDGKVKDMKIIRSLPFLTEAAEAAVKSWEFRPTLVDGHPVQVITTIPVNFALQ